MATPIGTEIHYDLTGASSYTQAPCPLISIDMSAGSMEKVERGHLGARFRPKTPGGQEGGQMTLRFECDSRIDAHWDFFQLMHAAYVAATMGTAGTEGIAWKTKHPKASADTVHPNRVHHGWVCQEPVLPSPEQGRMTFDAVIELIDTAALTDGS